MLARFQRRPHVRSKVHHWLAVDVRVARHCRVRSGAHHVQEDGPHALRGVRVGEHAHPALPVQLPRVPDKHVPLRLGNAAFGVGLPKQLKIFELAPAFQVLQHPLPHASVHHLPDAPVCITLSFALVGKSLANGVRGLELQRPFELLSARREHCHSQRVPSWRRCSTTGQRLVDPTFCKRAHEAKDAGVHGASFILRVHAANGNPSNCHPSARLDGIVHIANHLQPGLTICCRLAHSNCFAKVNVVFQFYVDNCFAKVSVIPQSCHSNRTQRIESLTQ
mmetsp:Transcript_27482/g.55295  ORF Transcript_27482/g.55295 Transcript_27482/m.55295 type:complete len:278 (+) Transcript_27482:669-1502(+)